MSWSGVALSCPCKGVASSKTYACSSWFRQKISWVIGPRTHCLIQLSISPFSDWRFDGLIYLTSFVRSWTNLLLQGFILWDTCIRNCFRWARLSDLRVSSFRIIVSRAWEVLLFGLKFLSQCNPLYFWSNISVLIISPRTMFRIFIDSFSTNLVLKVVKNACRLCLGVCPLWAVVSRPNSCASLLLSFDSNC